jgi:hypothetical protein
MEKKNLFLESHNPTARCYLFLDLFMEVWKGYMKMESNNRGA